MGHAPCKCLAGIRILAIYIYICKRQIQQTILNITGQNVQKFQILLFVASYVASILMDIGQNVQKLLIFSVLPHT